MTPDGISQNVRKGVLIFLGGEFTLTFDAAFIRDRRAEYQVFLEKVKALRQRVFDDRRNTWTMQVAPDSISCLAQLVNWGITPTKVAREKLSEELKKLAAANAVIQAQAEVEVVLEIPTAPHLAQVLKNYQKSGVRFMVEKRRAYNGDEMGLGKSLQALAAIELSGTFPAVIVCPPKLKQNWLKECRKWLPHRKASGLINDLAEISILSYTEIHKYVNVGLGAATKKEQKAALADTGRYFIPQIQRFRSITLDEGHFIKDPKSRRTMASRAIVEACQCDYRFVLSGTPVENRPAELIAPLEFLGLMEHFGGRYQYQIRYCGGQRNKFGFEAKGATNTLELYRRLTGLCYIRRKKKDVLKELPDKIESVYEAEVSNAAELRRIEQDVQAFIVEQKGKMLTENQVKAMAMMKLGILREATGRGKVEWLIEWVDTFLESGEKFVLYAYHPSVQQALLKGLAHWNPASVLAGCKDVAAEERKFMTDDTCRLFIGSIVAAGFGLTLTAASHIGIAELMWTHSKHKQVADRVHRIGQKDCVNVYYFLAPNTVDMLMWEVVSEKDQIVTSTADGEEVTKDAILANLWRKLQAA